LIKIEEPPVIDEGSRVKLIAENGLEKWRFQEVDKGSYRVLHSWIGIT